MNLEPYTLAFSLEWVLAWGLALLLIVGALGCLWFDWLRDLERRERDRHESGTWTDTKGGTDAHTRAE